MKSSKLFAVVVSSLTFVAAAHAARVDMTDPRRALGREDDVRVDAQLVSDSVAPGSPVAVTYQVENLTKDPIAVAGKVCDLSYDIDSRTITLSVGSEVPAGGEMPRVVTIAPGEKRTFTAGAILRIASPSSQSPFVSVPQTVQIRVNVLRNIAPFRSLIDQQAHATGPIALSDQQFDQWIQGNDTIELNAIPVHFNTSPRSTGNDASQRSAGASSY